MLLHFTSSVAKRDDSDAEQLQESHAFETFSILIRLAILLMMCRCLNILLTSPTQFCNASERAVLFWAKSFALRCCSFPCLSLCLTASHVVSVISRSVAAASLATSASSSLSCRTLIRVRSSRSTSSLCSTNFAT